MIKDKLILYLGSVKFGTAPLNSFRSIIQQIRDININYLLGDNFINDVVDKLRNSDNDSFNADDFIFLAAGYHYHTISEYDGAARIFITDKKMHTYFTKEVYGKGIPSVRGLGTIVISTSLMKSSEELSAILLHELGHIYLTPTKGRENSTDNKGIHCTNEGCIMQPRKKELDPVKSLCNILENKEIPYCSQCIENIKNYSFNNL